MIPDPTLDLGYKTLELLVAGRQRRVRVVLEVHHQDLVLRPTDGFDGAEEVVRLRLGRRAQEKVVGAHDEPFGLGPAEELLEPGRDVPVAVPVGALRGLDHAELVPLRPGPLEVQSALVLRMNVDPEQGLVYAHRLSYPSRPQAGPVPEAIAPDAVAVLAAYDSRGR